MMVGSTTKRVEAWKWPLGMVALLGACSPYPYAPEVTSFATAVASMGRSLDDGTRALAADRAMLDRARGGFGGAQLVVGGGCGVPGSVSSPCRLTLQPPSPNAPAPLSAEARATIAALGDYAESLRALSNAADRQAFDKASGEAVKAMGPLFALAGLAAPLVAVAPAAGTAFLGMVGQGLDYERYLRLRNAVRDAHPAVVSLAPGIATAVTTIRNDRISTMVGTLDAVTDGLPRQSGSANRLAGHDIAVERTAALNALKGVDPNAVARDLVAAHAALRDALADPERGFENFRAAAERFAREVAVLRDSLATINAQ